MSRRVTTGAFLALGILACLATPSKAAETARVVGLVRDVSGGVVPGAQVSLLYAQRDRAASGETDRQGRFSFSGVRPGRYVLAVQSRGFAERRQAVTVQAGAEAEVHVTLEPAVLREEVSVTASPGSVEDVATLAQQVNLIGEQRILERAKSVVAQVANEEAGLHLQRTSPTMSGIFVRGLTGNKVNVFVDGVRYSTAAARGGVNTFLNLVEPTSLQSVEVLRGPSSAQYGSDAIGGSVQFLSRVPSFTETGSRVTGTFGTSFGSADTSFSSHLTTAWATPTFALQGNVAGRRVNRLRPGQGRDSHNAVTRFLGLDSDVVIDGGRLPDTAFTQYGGSLKALWAKSASSQVTASYSRSQQDGGKRYDQLLGGDGNLVADLRNLMLDNFYLRFDRRELGPADHLSLTYSFESQREERVNQGGSGNPAASINHEYERTSVHGLVASAVKQWGRHALTLGGDAYREGVNAPSFGFNPNTGAITTRRGRVPDEARFTSGGAFLQDAFEAVPNRLRLSASARWSAASYRVRAADSPLVNNRPLWPDDSLDVSSPTFRVGAVVTPLEGFHLLASVSRGFRAPHITDLGTLGLTGAGYEVAAPDVAGLGGTLGTTASGTAVGTGRPVEQLRPETSLSYEGGVRIRRGRLGTDLAVFVNDVDDNITKQALILPPGAVGLLLGDQPITSQNANGAVFVSTSTSPVLVRANFDDARIWGVEHSLDLRLGRGWSFRTAATYLRARDRATGLPPNIEGGTPPAEAFARLRYAPEGRRFWIEPYAHAADRQERLSSLDLEDRRTGAGRSRSSIASFFNNGARARGLIGDGPDGRPGTADDVLLATGETLAQVQNRVLGTSVASGSLFPAIPGYFTFGLRGGVRLGQRHEIMADLENIGDRNYRGPSWGLDAPGRGVFVRYVTSF